LERPLTAEEEVKEIHDREVVISYRLGCWERGSFTLFLFYILKI